jgi:hypothetical protein
MENLLDLANQDETQILEATQASAVTETAETEAITPPPTEVQSEPPAGPEVLEEIDTAPKAQVAKALPGRAVTKPAPYKREEPPPNPLLLDPYEWDKCTITVGYSLLPDKKVSVSVHNHKDEPIVKEFPVDEVPFPVKISGVMETLQRIWPTSPVNTTVVLLPKPDDAPERSIIASVRVSTDTPIMQEGVESNLPFPAPIIAMLDELKALMPERALKNIEKNAKTKTVTAVKPASKSTASTQSATVSAPAANKNVRQNQMTLF